MEERYALMRERLESIAAGSSPEEPFSDYFEKMAAYLLRTADLLERAESGETDRQELAACQADNAWIYAPISPAHYPESYCDPAFAVKELGADYGQLLSFLAAEVISLPAWAYERRRMHITLYFELFAQIEASFEDAEWNTPGEIRDIIYWFYHDYSEIFSEDRVRDMVDPDYDFFTGIVMDSDLEDPRYLYRYGEYISDNELQISAYLNTLSEEQIRSMADTMTEGFRIGYANMGKEISRKSSVCVEYPIGFERVIRQVIRNFADMGLKSTVYRCPNSSFARGNGGKRGCYSSSVNKQFEFDHRYDRALYLDKAFVERRLETMQAAYEKYKKCANQHAGPAVMEIFGEIPFSPVTKPECCSYSVKQNELNVALMSRSGQLVNSYIPGDERCFTIIAYPCPSIGERFEEIFAETVKLNTLDYRLYQQIQQKLIDVLDQAKEVHVKGRGANRTDIRVQIHPLEDPAKESAFENCVADVNIPVGEVFTSPVLEGTDGKLYVSQVYLNELKYTDLEIDFRDGRIRDYTCSNFASQEENRAYIYNNVLMQHETLPIGEFAIGTNTTAYRMAKDYGIFDKLPILIAEKTGPHFAVGDTCYSHSEDTRVYNPDGKEIIAKENTISAKRREDLQGAYFNCHTDITIPYDELGSITVIRRDGTTVDIIRDGRFVVPGTEALNEPLL